jgi:hypothetical protein
MREDTGSNDTEGAEAHEKLRAERDDPPQLIDPKYCCRDQCCPCGGFRLYRRARVDDEQ